MAGWEEGISDVATQDGSQNTAVMSVFKVTWGAAPVSSSPVAPAPLLWKLLPDDDSTSIFFFTPVAPTLQY